MSQVFDRSQYFIDTRTKRSIFCWPSREFLRRQDNQYPLIYFLIKVANRAKSNPSWNRANRKKHDASVSCLGIFINRVESSFVLQHDVRSLGECWGEFAIRTGWICMNLNLRPELRGLRYTIDLALKCFERYSFVMTHYMDVWLLNGWKYGDHVITRWFFPY